MPNTAPIDWPETFENLGVTLTNLEQRAIDAAITNMSQPNGDARGKIDNY